MVPKKQLRTHQPRTPEVARNVTKVWALRGRRFKGRRAAAREARAAVARAATESVVGRAPHVLFLGLAFLSARQLTIDTDAQKMTVL